MKLPRRQFLHLAAGTVAFAAGSRIARAEIYPSRAVRVIVPFGAGAPPDIVARLMGQWLSEHLGGPFIIENRPGAGTNMGTEAVIRAAADGYTLLWAPTATAINATLYENLHFNFMRDTTPVAGCVRLPNVMAVNPSVPAKTVPEFIAYAKANPGKINFASGGDGTTPHLTAELFKMMTGIDMVHVPYRSTSQATTDLIGGQIQVMFITPPGTIQYIRAGTLRALAVTTASRLAALPDIPTVGEFVAGYEASSWWGVIAPKNTPNEIVDMLNKEINAGLADPNMKARLADLGAVSMPMTPAEFGKFIAEETEKWGKVVRFSGAKVD